MNAVTTNQPNRRGVPGRQVRRGEHGVKVITYVYGEREKSEADPQTGEERKVKRSFSRPWTAERKVGLVVTRFSGSFPPTA